MTTTQKEARLSFWTKLVFGAGDWSVSSFGTLRQIFYAIFITDVVGLEPRLASVAAEHQHDYQGGEMDVLDPSLRYPVVADLDDRGQDHHRGGGKNVKEVVGEGE